MPRVHLPDHRRSEAAMVTAETAVVLPFVVLVLLVAVWVVTLGLTQVRLVDAAREGARAAARGDSLAAVRSEVARASPDGARVEVSEADGTTRVVVVVRRELDVPLLAGHPGVSLRAEAVTATEGGGT